VRNYAHPYSVIGFNSDRGYQLQVSRMPEIALSMPEISNVIVIALFEKGVARTMSCFRPKSPLMNGMDAPPFHSPKALLSLLSRICDL